MYFPPGKRNISRFPEYHVSRIYLCITLHFTEANPKKNLLHWWGNPPLPPPVPLPKEPLQAAELPSPQSCPLLTS